MKNASSTNQQFYTWGIVTYGTENQVKRFCNEQGKNWAFACHDKDTNKDGVAKEAHTHIVITFEQRKSFASVVRLAKSYMTDCNSMAEPVHDIGAVIAYLTHETEEAIRHGKYQYDREIVRYSKKEFYTKYMKGEEISENDQFVDDLLCPEKDFSVIRMAKRYGRDFIKNAGKYIEFRSMALAEVSGVNPLHYHYASYSASEREFFRENAEAVNSFVKEQ